MMNKKILLTVVAATMMASVASASPLKDYSKGKTAIDVMTREADSRLEGDSLAKKSNPDLGITVGLGDNMAIQYTSYNAKSKDTVVGGNILGGSLKTKEFNLLSKLSGDISGYVGVVAVDGIFTDNGVSYSSNVKNKIQFGLVDSIKITKKTSAYASVGLASDYTNWKIGVSQEIARNLELNVDYRRIQLKNVTCNNVAGNVDIKVKGLGYGVTYKF